VLPQDAINEIEGGRARAVYLVLGEEHVFSDRVVTTARRRVVDAATVGFNVDVFEAGETPIARVIDAAQTAPMMSRRRLVILRGLERLERPAESEAPKGKGRSSPGDQLAEYVASPNPSSCLLLVGTKIDQRRRLATVAKKADVIVSCDPLRPNALVPFLRDEAKRRGNVLAFDVAEAIVDLVGGELGALVDAIERLSLYAGKDAPITEDAVHACIARVRVGSIWGLADAVTAKDRATALVLLNENYDPGDRGLPLLGLLASSIRKMLKLRALLAEGLSADDAAKRAGLPPFKARDAAAQARRFKDGELEHAVAVFAEADLALKGSRRAPLLVLEEAITRLT
jgi:DNA polymerase-3 subunit delta